MCVWNNVAVVGIVIWYILDDDADDAIIKPDICHSDHNQKWIQINLVQKWDLKKIESDSSGKKVVYTDFVPKGEDLTNNIFFFGKKTP